MECSANFTTGKIGGESGPAGFFCADCNKFLASLNRNRITGIAVIRTQSLTASVAVIAQQIPSRGQMTAHHSKTTKLFFEWLSALLTLSA